MSHPARLPIETLLQACSVKRTRGSGPGGQHRNKVETAIVITHLPTAVIGQASEKRSQKHNRDVAIERLRINLALAVRSETGIDTQPSELWCSRVKSKKIQVNIKHEDFPALLSEALDFTNARGFEIAAAAEALGVSTSQLIKFFKASPAAFEYVNRQRESRELRRLS